MRRRHVVTSLAALTLAGCLEETPSSEDEQYTSDDGTDTSSDDGNDTSSEGEDDTSDALSETRPDSRFEGEDLPSLSSFRSNVRFYHETPDAEVALVPEAETGSLPERELEFVLENEGDGAVLFNSADTATLKLVDEHWHTAPPQGDVTLAESSLDEGDSRDFSRSVDNTDPSGVLYGPGTYAYFLSANAPDADVSGVAAVFELEGDEPDLVPVYDEAERDRDGATVTYTTSAYEAESADRRGVISVERSDGQGGRDLLLEQLTVADSLQTAVAEFDAADDLETVEMAVEYDEWFPVIKRLGSSDDEPYTFEYESQAFSARYTPDEDLE